MLSSLLPLLLEREERGGAFVARALDPLQDILLRHRAEENDEGGAHPLTELILADYLVVDVTKPYAEQGSFIEIELAARRGEANTTCGGRALNDDVMDTLFNQLVNAGNGPVIRDGVDQATQPASREFPYLAAANPHPPEKPEHH